MESYFFTCGQSHIHQLGGGKTWDKDSVLQVNAENEDLAREKVFSLFGPKWAMCYNADEIKKSMHYFPKGICAVIQA